MIYNIRISPEIYSKIIDLDEILFNSIRLYHTLPLVFSNKLQHPAAMQLRKNISHDLKEGLLITLEINKLINEQ